MSTEKPVVEKPVVEKPVAWRKRLTRAERLVLLAGAAVLLLAAAYFVRTRYTTEGRRSALLAKSAAEAASLTPREADILAAARAFILESAAPDYPGDIPPGAPAALAALAAKPGLYVRLAQPDAAPRFLAEAVRASPKDAFVLCFLTPPENTADYDITLAATRTLPGTPAFDEATRKVQRLDVVQRGLRVLSATWVEEVKAADSTGLRALEYEFEKRTPDELAAAKSWAAAAYLIVIVDELPPGMKIESGATALADSFRAPLLPAIHPKPHESRVTIYDLESKKPTLRTRLHVDVASFAKRTGLNESPAAQDCLLGATSRKAAPPR